MEPFATQCTSSWGLVPINTFFHQIELQDVYFLCSMWISKHDFLCLKTLLSFWCRFKEEFAIGIDCISYMFKARKGQSFSNMQYIAMNCIEIPPSNTGKVASTTSYCGQMKWSVGRNCLTCLISSTHWLIVGTPINAGLATPIIFLWPPSCCTSGSIASNWSQQLPKFVGYHFWKFQTPHPIP